MQKNKDLVTRRASEGKSDRQPAAPTVWRDPVLRALRKALAELKLAERGTDNGWVNDDAVAQARYKVLKAAIQVAKTVEAEGFLGALGAPPCPRHVCGLSGYNGMIDPPCPACEARFTPGHPPPSADARPTPVDEGKASGSATDSSLRDQLAHLTEEWDVMQAKLRGLPPTVAAGLIQRLQDENAALTEEREGLRAKFDALARWSRDEIAALTAAHERLKTLLTDVASSGFEDIDPRIDYVDVQIDRELWTELRSALTSLEGPPQETR